MILLYVRYLTPFPKVRLFSSVEQEDKISEDSIFFPKIEQVHPEMLSSINASPFIFFKYSCQKIRNISYK